VSQPTRPAHFTPIFSPRDLRRASAHYESIGFSTHPYEGPEQYGFADRDGVGLRLTEQSGHDPSRDAGATYLYVEDADALCEEWTRPGVAGMTHSGHPTEYGLREGAHVDPDGNLIRFGSPVDANNAPTTEETDES
jgi:catechol 2,3-dioxygenase-like lactoylglutathione lyase family enzyme